MPLSITWRSTEPSHALLLLPVSMSIDSSGTWNVTVVEDEYASVPRLR